MQDNLIKMERFFKYNMEIKKILYETMPKEEDNYNKFSIMKYVDKLFKSLNDLEYYINFMLENFNFSKEDKKHVKNFVKALKFELIKCVYNFDKLKKIYEVCFANMREQLVNEVGESCVGYSYHRGLPLSNAKSINEILHVIHQTIINNERNLESLPKIDEKINKYDCPIFLYGIGNNISNEIFNKFPLELFCGWTDIVSLSNDKVIMMVRDRGHALSIEIERENDKYYVRYFIPRIFNVNMVNKLNGVRKVTEESKFTTGIFETDLENLSFSLFDFISKVPTDSDSFDLSMDNNFKKI